MDANREKVKTRRAGDAAVFFCTHQRHPNMPSYKALIPTRHFPLVMPLHRYISVPRAVFGQDVGVSPRPLPGWKRGYSQTWVF